MRPDEDVLARYLVRSLAQATEKVLEHAGVGLDWLNDFYPVSLWTGAISLLLLRAPGLNRK